MVGIITNTHPVENKTDNQTNVNVFIVINYPKSHCILRDLVV